MATATGEGVPVLTEGELAFVDRIADYYEMNDGMPRERGRVIGWLVICDPPEQEAGRIAATLGVSREAVSRVADQLSPSGVARRTDLGDGRYTLRIDDDAWPRVVGRVFSHLPRFHAILQEGLEALRDAPAERRRRLADVEELFGYLATRVPAVFERYEQARAAEPEAHPRT